MYPIRINREISSEMQMCIQNCLDCHSICLTTVPHCLQMGGEHAGVQHISILLDCATICQTSADFMLLNSPVHGRVCGVCAAVCERCRQDCLRLAHGDEQMLACAEMCSRCAESCKQMAQMAA